MRSISSSRPVVSAGMDWLTCTAQQPSRVAALLDFGRDIISQEEGSGAVRKGWHWQGYSGWQAGGAGYGFNGAGAILRLSGATARELAADAISGADNVSRLDVQATVTADGIGSDHAIRLYAGLAGTRGGRGRPISRSLIQTSYGGDSLYLGRRISDAYGRVYNKSAEEKESAQTPRWRYEVEYKRKPAAAQARAYCEASDREAWCVARVYHWFSDRGCAPPIGPLQRVNDPGTSRGNSSQARRVQWLRRGVRPVVEQLAREFGWVDTLALLGVPVRYIDPGIDQCIVQEDS